ncbi:unnamed protein product, partial [Rotaria socialis]
TYDQTNLIIRNVTDDELLDDLTLEQKFDFNFTQSDVKDRIEIINELLIGNIIVSLHSVLIIQVVSFI